MARPSVVIPIVIYALGLVLAFATAVNGLTDESPVEWIVGLAMAAAIWWIAAGVAIRIGLLPRDFFTWLGSFVGLAGRDRR